MRVRGDEPGFHVDVGDRRLFVHTGGRELQGAFPLVLLLHGAGHDHTVWGRVAEHLAAHAISVMSVDLPGHGRSPGPPDATIEQSATLISQLIAESVHDAATLVGHSMGALIALEVAATSPHLTERLVLVGSGATMPVNDRLLEAAVHDPTTAHALLERWSHSRSVGEAARRTTRELHEALEPGVLATALAACNSYTAGRARAASVVAPTLVVRGEHDVMVGDEQIASLVDALPDVTDVVVPDAGHNTMVEAPGELIEALERFFAAHPSSL